MLFIYNKMHPMSLYKECRVVKLKIAPSVFYTDVMTVEKSGQLWSVPISRDVFNQLEVGSAIDFYYNGDVPVEKFEMCAFKNK